MRRNLVLLPERTGGVELPQVCRTVTAHATPPTMERLRRNTGTATAALIGLIAFAVLEGRYWRAMLTLVPLILPGVLALLSARRFVIYTASCGGFQQ